MRRYKRGGCLAALVVGLAMLGADTEAALPAGNGPIVYDGLHIVSPQGANDRRLPLPVRALNPVFSPDGKHILFSAYSADDGTWPLYLTDRAGRVMVRLHTGAGYVGPSRASWAPDSRRVVFSISRRIGGREDLRIYNIRTERTRQLTGAGTDRLGVYHSQPAWSPDGSRIVYSRGTVWDSEYGYINGPADLYTISPRGGSPVRLTHTNQVSEEGASWSPSGGQIVYATMSIDDPRNPKYSLGLDVIAADGTDRRLLIEGYYLEPAWSPDGRFIAAAKRGSTFEGAERPGLWRINATTGTGIRLLAGKRVANPDWGVRR